MTIFSISRRLGSFLNLFFVSGFNVLNGIIFGEIFFFLVNYFVLIYISQLHLEAAHVLQYTEDEFLQTLDWKPFGHHEGQKTN